MFCSFKKGSFSSDEKESQNILLSYYLDTDQETWSVRFPHDKKRGSDVRIVNYIRRKNSKQKITGNPAMRRFIIGIGNQTFFVINLYCSFHVINARKPCVYNRQVFKFVYVSWISVPYHWNRISILATAMPIMITIFQRIESYVNEKYKL